MRSKQSQPTVAIAIAAVLVLVPGFGGSAGAADVILNEYNAVGGSKLLESGASDPFWGVRAGNGGDWFELVVITDHLDMRGWELVVVDRAGDPAAERSFSLRLTDEQVWSDLRSGTIVTISEDLGNNEDDYEPLLGQWWLNVRAGGDSSGRFVTATCISPACTPDGVNWRVTNNNWQLTIRDAAGAVVFGPAGEGVAPVTGAGSTEVVKLEEDPSATITPLSSYHDGSSSTFGRPNRFGGGSVQQSLSALRSVVAYSPLTSVVINEVFSHYDPGEDWVELFNTTGAAIDIGGWFLSDNIADLTRFEIPAGTMIGAFGYRAFFETELGFALSSACGDELILSVGDGVVPTGARDHATFGAVETGVSFGRTPDGMGPIVRLAAATMGTGNAVRDLSPVVINEVMYNPAAASPGVSVDAEFVELHNATDTPITLATSYGLDGTFGWRLRGGIDFDFAHDTMVAPRDYLLVVAFDPVARPDLLAEFLTLYGIGPATPIVGPYAGGLNNFSDTVRLAKPDTPESDGSICGGSDPGPFVPAPVIDAVTYVDFAPWPSQADGGGASLERIEPGAYGDDPASWIADAGGGPTPGTRNSISPTTTLPDPECADDLECDDANPCTDDACDFRFQCSNVPLDIPCDDGLSCTTDDQCIAGVCVGAPPCDLVCSRCDGGQCSSRCGVPISSGVDPVVSDALFVLQVSVGVAACQPCRCDVDSSGRTTATDAFRILIRAVGVPVELACPAS